MQVHMDCAFNNITFVCTKTDDISVSEVQVSLKLGYPKKKVCNDAEAGEVTTLNNDPQEVTFVGNSVIEMQCSGFSENKELARHYQALKAEKKQLDYQRRQLNASLLNRSRTKRKSLSDSGKRANPLLEIFVGGWTRIFCVKVPQQLNQFAARLSETLQMFHKGAIALAGKSAKETPEEMLNTYCKPLEHELNQLEASISKRTKSAQSNVVPKASPYERHNDSRSKRQLWPKTTVGHVLRDYCAAVVGPQIRKLADDQVKLKNDITGIIQTTKAKIHLDKLLGLDPGKNGQPKLSVASEVVVKSEEKPM
ncbi:hypothetical protein ETB97_003587 [Aspergillus alliaceus]|uniref:Uncharacterized protein n=1 Tax=Petromyces alliaceus TaxID=209559 RepID=A0A8H6A124_PETAA|nr:hypothetical protein ETB97_003587 [Aspergillus burnettii]